MKHWKQGFIGFLVVIALIFTACDNGNGDTHTHNYSTTWSKDATNHWHECSCGDKTDIAPHDWSGWEEKIAPTQTTNRIEVVICLICGFTNNEREVPFTYIGNLADDYYELIVDIDFPNIEHIDTYRIVRSDESVPNEVYIPATYNGKTVSSIGRYSDMDTTGTDGLNLGVFRGRTNITAVHIPDSVTSVWYRAFNGCSSLESIIIPENVILIYRQAFSSCNNLTSVTFQSANPFYYSFDYTGAFSGDLIDKYLAEDGGIGTYTRNGEGTSESPYIWTKQ